MTKQRNICILDDEEQKLAKQVKADIGKLSSVRSEFRVTIITGEQFKDSLEILEERRETARKKKPAKSRDSTNGKQTVFDGIDILIVDYDLLYFKESVSGEDVAYLARCYSHCGLIIALNQFGDNPFDLTLRGHPQSFADLNVGSGQIGNKGLWKARWTGPIFRPWYWPVLPQALDAFNHRVDEIVDNLDRPILEYLGLSKVVPILLRSVKSFLGKEEKVEEFTFRTFVKESGNGLRSKDEPLSDEFIARIAAARVSKWMERMVFPGQDILVDAPHLVLRFPSLLSGDPRKPATWNKTCIIGGVTDLGINNSLIEEYRFKKEHWLSRPAWFWNQLSEDQRLLEVNKPWETKHYDFVFCEDVSRFLPSDSAKDFIADLMTPFIRRFVVNPKIGEGKKYADSLRKVDYFPALRFSL